MKDISHIPPEVIDKISSVFRKHGFDGASLSKLSEASGLGRSSLYHYFPNGKDDMAAASMIAIGEFFTKRVIEPLSDNGRKPEARLKAALQGVAEFYDHGRASCLVDVFSIGDEASLHRNAVGGQAAALLNALAKLSRSAGFTAGQASNKAEQALVALQGALVVARATRDPKVFDRALKTIPNLLLS